MVEQDRATHITELPMRRQVASRLDPLAPSAKRATNITKLPMSRHVVYRLDPRSKNIGLTIWQSLIKTGKLMLWFLGSNWRMLKLTACSSTPRMVKSLLVVARP